jgi:predicted permease
METFLQDLRYSLRGLRKNPGFALTAALVLALGIGANTAIFSVVYSVLLKPLAYRDPGRLAVALHEGSLPVSPADFLDYRREVRAFDQMAAAQVWGVNLTGGDRAESVHGMQVTANLPAMLGVEPQFGRVFRPEEDQPGAGQLVVMSHGLWQRRFGADPRIVGQTVKLNGAPFTVIGVMPAEFHFAPFWATNAELWTPLTLDRRANDRGGRSLRVFARLRHGVSWAEAQAQMDAVARRLAEQYPATNAKLGITVLPLQEKVTRTIRPTLLALLGAVAFVLLIACANVANLMLTRAMARRKETAVRLALGAGRLRLARQSIVESLCVAAIGGIVGVMFARWGLYAMLAILPQGGLPRRNELAMNAAALAFAVLITLITGLLAGIAPVLEAGAADLNSGLKEGGRSSTEGGSRKRARSALVAAEVALALVLLAGAGLTLRTLAQLNAVDAGFDPMNVLTFQVSTEGSRHAAPEMRALLYAQVAERLAALPGVESVGAINHLPLGGDIWTLPYKVEGAPALPAGEELGAVYRVIRAGYFATMRQRVVQGRDFSERDDERASSVVIVNEALARRRWPGADPLGKRISMSEPFGAPVWMTVVGVAKNARQADWTGNFSDEAYLPYAQHSKAFGLSYLTFVARTARKPETFFNAARELVAGVDREAPVSEVATIEHVIADTLWRSRTAAALLAMFAAVALALAAVGIYGVVSYAVRRRTQEIGIRMALGASRRDVVGLALAEGMQPVWIGVALGLALSFALTRFLSTLLYQVTATDPYTFGAVTLALIGVAALAHVLPARRASRVDPLTALRHE